MEIELTREDGPLEAAAGIWARATAARDGEHAVASLAEAKPVLAAVLAGSPEAALAVVRGEGRVLGFAAIEPSGERQGATVRYLGVEPDSWGRGVARGLLGELPGRLRALGYRRASLTVYVDNDRAVALYERAGWQAHGAPKLHPRTGRPEQRYELEL